ncbi:ABC transporter permease [Herbiconiux sp. P16]|uniref:ABC transporter permease n=1 Tax=Herbiconiux wuyangfengii TaxID=3342794 RepID=UPI0035B926E0
MFVFLLILIAVIHGAVNERRDPPVVEVVASGIAAQNLQHRLIDEGIDATLVESASLTGETTATIQIGDTRAVVTLAYPHPPAWIEIERTIEGMEYPPTAIDVVRKNGTVETDILRINLSTVLIAGFMAIVFFGTSVPIVAMRRRGTLRILGTTPLPRMTFLLAQSPVRLGLGLAETAVVVAIAAVQGYTNPGQSGRLAMTMVIGLAMLFSLGFLLAARSRNPDLVAQLCGLIPVVIVLTSGTMFPLQGVPEPVIVLMRAVPTSWFMQAAGADIAGTAPFVPIPLLWAMMAAATCVCTVLAARTFVWDQGDR